MSRGGGAHGQSSRRLFERPSTRAYGLSHVTTSGMHLSYTGQSGVCMRCMYVLLQAGQQPVIQKMKAVSPLRPGERRVPDQLGQTGCSIGSQSGLRADWDR